MRKRNTPVIVNDFWDMDAEERGSTYRKAERETGMSFFDLSPEERGRYYDQATRRR